MSTEIIISLISSVIGGLLVAIVNLFFMRKRTEAETDKFKAEADKIRAETNKIRAEIGELSAVVNEVNYSKLSVNDVTIYDGKGGQVGYDFEKTENQWFSVFQAEDNLLTFTKTDCKVRLKKYIYQGSELDYLPKNPQVGKIRKFKLTFESRVTQGTWALHAYITGTTNTEIYQSRDISIAADSDKTIWKNITWYFRFPSEEDCFLEFSCGPLQDQFALKMGDKELQKETLERSKEGRLQIRNIVLIESINAG